MKDYNMPFKNSAIDKMSTKFGKGPGLPNPWVRPNPLEQAIKGKPVRNVLEEAVMYRPSTGVKPSKVNIPTTPTSQTTKPVATPEKADIKHPITNQLKKNIVSNLERKSQMTAEERMDLRNKRIKNVIDIGSSLITVLPMLRNK